MDDFLLHQLMRAAEEGDDSADDEKPDNEAKSEGDTSSQTARRSSQDGTEEAEDREEEKGGKLSLEELLAELKKSQQLPEGLRGLGLGGMGIAEDTAQSPKHNFIVAIDLGTKYSGYAFQQTSVKGSYNEMDDEITPFVNWGGGAVYNNYKTPTCVLLTSQGQLMAFGQEAVDRFVDMEAEEQENALFFELFKMTLYTEVQRQGSLEKNYKLKAKNGKELPAIKVFGSALDHLKSHFYSMIETRVGFEVRPDDVLWVLTVPAIWDDSAKQFMREAAYEGGLVRRDSAERLILALEPEAAALHCRTLSFSGFYGGSAGADFSAPKKGDKYLVVDAGGGTVDITAHETVDERAVKEVERASGGAHGGSQVDENFTRLLENIFGKDFIQDIRERTAPELVQVMQYFETGKRKCGFKDFLENPEGARDETPLTVCLSYDFCQLYQKFADEHPKEAIARYNNENIIWRGGCLKIKLEEAQKLFLPVISRIVALVERLLSQENLKDVKSIYLVGGFSDCALMRHEMMRKFSNVRVLVPCDAGLAVLKGAVRFARNPSSVTERVLRNTYGTDISQEFIDGVHPEERREWELGGFRCGNIFSGFVQAGDTVKFGETIERQYFPISSFSTSVGARIYSSPRRHVSFVDEPDCRLLGEVRVDVPFDPQLAASKEKRWFQLKFHFGSTEIRVTTVDTRTGRSNQVTFNILS